MSISNRVSDTRIDQIKKSLHQGGIIDREYTPFSVLVRSDFRSWSDKSISRTTQWSREQPVPGGCKGRCEYLRLVVSPPRTRGFTCQAEGIRYCRRCAKHFKKEAGLRCPCCKQLLSTRIRSKQSRRYREQIIAQKQEEDI